MDQVEEIKQKLDIVEVVGGYVTLKRGGKNFKGLCPFHGEKTPSFMVNPELQIYKCFGCGEGGDIYSFIQKIEAVEFGEALRMMAEKAGVELVFKGDQEQKSKKDQLLGIMELATEYYHYLLTEHEVGKRGREYLQKRGVENKLIEQFRLGYALDSWDGLRKYLGQKKGLADGLLEEAGLVIKTDQGRYYDRFRNRIIFPLTDHRGRVMGFGGRILSNEKEAKYINSPETLIYHKSQMLYGLFQAKKTIKEKDRVIVVEGEMDMISSFAAGVGETVAVKGTALTRDQLLLLSRLTKNIILSLDADLAGEEATKRSIELAEGLEMSVGVVRIKGGKDPDEIAQNNPSEWEKMVEAAEDIYEFYFQLAREKFGVNTGEAKRRVSGAVVPVLARIQNRVVLAHYVRKLASELGVGEESVMAEIERVGKGQDLGWQIEPEEKKEEKSRKEKLAEEILALLLASERSEAVKMVKKLLKLGVESGLARILDRLAKSSSPSLELVKSLPGELRQMAEVAYMMPVDETRVGRDLKEAVGEWERLRGKERLAELKTAITGAEREGNGEKMKQLEEEVAEVVKWLNYGG